MGREVNVSGQVSGPVVASKKLVIGRSGSVTGDVRVPRLVMADGATLSGNVQMGPQSGASQAAEPAAPAAEQAPVEVAVVAQAAATDGKSDQSKAKRR